MGYPEHWLLQFGGHQGDVNEEWSCGIRMAVYGTQLPGAEVEEEEYLDDVAVTALSDWFGRADSKIHNDAKLLTIKFNKINPQGGYVDQSQTHQRQVNISGGVGHSDRAHPLQIACVLSWRNNDVARGPGSHGRIYSPRPVVAVTAQGDVAGADRVSICDSAVLLINTLDVGLDNPAGAVLRPSIVSAIGSGVARQIDRVVVDSCLDVQRRRAKSQSKEVTSAPVLY